MPKTVPVNVRMDADALAALERIGKSITPKPLNRSEMINVAVRDYVARHATPAKPKAK